MIKDDKQQSGQKLYLSIKERCPEFLALRIIFSIKGSYYLLIRRTQYNYRSRKGGDKKKKKKKRKPTERDSMREKGRGGRA